MHQLGAIEWQNEVTGFCRCPGEARHTTPNGPKDCRVSLDGVPTIFCFHASCGAAIAEANRQLRRELGRTAWKIARSGRQPVRNGDVVQSTGRVLSREVIQATAGARGQDAGERLVLETLSANAKRFLPNLLKRFHWPLDAIIAESPMQVAKLSPQDQFRAWLQGMAS